MEVFNQHDGRALFRQRSRGMDESRLEGVLGQRLLTLGRGSPLSSAEKAGIRIGVPVKYSFSVTSSPSAPNCSR
jgi:hypothetical protein